MRADSRHREDINRLIHETRIGPSRTGASIKGPISRNTWIARLDGRVVGCAQLGFVGNKAAILKSLAVEEDFRHQGIGSALINRRIEAAEKRGINVFALITMYYHFNFYKRRGFKTCPRKYLPEFLRNYPQFTAKRYMKCAVMVRGVPVRRNRKQAAR